MNFWTNFTGVYGTIFSSRSKSSRSHSFGVTSSWRVNAYGVTSSSRKLFFYHSFTSRVLVYFLIHFSIILLQAFSQILIILNDFLMPEFLEPLNDNFLYPLNPILLCYFHLGTFFSKHLVKSWYFSMIFNTWSSRASLWSIFIFPEPFFPQTLFFLTFCQNFIYFHDF